MLRPWLCLLSAWRYRTLWYADDFNGFLGCLVFMLVCTFILWTACFAGDQGPAVRLVGGVVKWVEMGKES